MDAKRARLAEIARKSEDPAFWSDNAKAQALLGYEPTVDLEQGLRHTLAWCRSENAAAASRFCKSARHEPKRSVKARSPSSGRASSRHRP